MPLVIILASILVLLLLIMVKWPPVLALLVVAIFAGLAQGMSISGVFQSIESGMGSTLGGVTMILLLGAMFGKIIEESGAAIQITNTLIRWFGRERIQWAVMLTGFIVGIPLFYNAGFVILVPLIFSIAASARVPLLHVGIPMAASLSVTHGFLPPHPGPVAIASIFGADIGKILLYGFILSVPAVILAGPVFSKTLRSIVVKPPSQPIAEKPDPGTLPSASLSLCMALLPVVLIAVPTVLEMMGTRGNFFIFLGEPVVALLLSVLMAAYFLMIQNGKKVAAVSSSLIQSVGGVAMIIFIIGAGGAFKQVLVDGGVSDYIILKADGFSLSPLLLGWLVAAILRVSIGSATVAALTAAGIVQPLIEQQHVSPELMVLAVGSGSLMFSHVNDTGFWMFKEYFNLSLRQTFRSWSIMETIVSVTGLLGVLLLNSIL